MDERDNKWYKAKIKQIADGFMLIHFMKWSDKFDVWYPLNSELIRQYLPGQKSQGVLTSTDPTSNYSVASNSESVKASNMRRDPRSRPSVSHQFHIGERVIAKWRDNVEYVAYITHLFEGGDYEVRYLDNVTQRVRATSIRHYTEEYANQLFERDRKLQEESVSRNMMWYDPVSKKIQTESRERRRLQRERQRNPPGMAMTSNGPRGGGASRGGHQGGMHQPRWTDRGMASTSRDQVGHADPSGRPGGSNLPRNDRWNNRGNMYQSEMGDGSSSMRQPNTSGNNRMSYGAQGIAQSQVHPSQNVSPQRSSIQASMMANSNAPPGSRGGPNPQFQNRQPMRHEVAGGGDNRNRRFDMNQGPYRGQPMSSGSQQLAFHRTNQPMRVRGYPEAETVTRPRSARVTRSPRRFSDHVLLQYRGSASKRQGSAAAAPDNRNLPVQSQRHQTGAGGNRGRRGKMGGRAPNWRARKAARAALDPGAALPQPMASSSMASTSQGIDAPPAIRKTQYDTNRMTRDPVMSMERVSQPSIASGSTASMKGTQGTWSSEAGHEERDISEIASESSTGRAESVHSHGSPFLYASTNKRQRFSPPVEKAPTGSFDEPSMKRRRVESKEMPSSSTAPEEAKEEVSTASTVKPKHEPAENIDSAPYIVRCMICRSNDESLSTIQCDVCQCWVHMECYKLDPEMDPPSYFECLGCQQPKRLRKSRLGSWRYSWLRQTCNSLPRLRQQVNHPQDPCYAYRNSIKNLQRCFDLTTFLRKAQAMEVKHREELEALAKEHTVLTENGSCRDGEAMLKIVERAREIRKSQEELKIILDAVKEHMSSYTDSSTDSRQDKSNNPWKEIRRFLMALNKQARVLNLLQVFSSPDACSCVW